MGGQLQLMTLSRYNYFNKQQKIMVEGGCLLWGIHVIVPEKLQKKLLDKLHKDHLGIVRMKSKAVAMCGGQEYT